MRQLIALENKFDSTNNAEKSFLDTIKEKTWDSWSGNLASMFSIYDEMCIRDRSISKQIIRLLFKYT